MPQRLFFEQEDPTPARGGLNCGKQPCRSPPTITASNVDFFMDRVLIPDLLQTLERLRGLVLAAGRQRDDQGVDNAHRRDERIP